MSGRRSPAQRESKAQMIEAALSLFDQSLDLLTQQLPKALSARGGADGAPLPSLLEACEAKLSAVVQRRGPRLIEVMPGLPQLEAAWWRGRLAGVQCLALPEQSGDVLRATVEGLWRQSQSEGRALLLVATPQVGRDLGMPLNDRVLLVADPWVAFSADKSRRTTLQDLCLATLDLIEAEPDLRIVKLLPGQDAAAEALGMLGLGSHLRKAAGMADMAASAPDPDVVALAPAYATLCKRLGFDATPPAAFAVASPDTVPAPRIRVSGLIRRIAEMGLADMPASQIEPQLWALADQVSGLVFHVSDFPDRIDAAARALSAMDGALLRILAAGHFGQTGNKLQALTLLAEALDELPPRDPRARDVRLVVASLQLELEQPRLAAKAVLGELTGLNGVGKKALLSLTGAEGIDNPADHGHSLLLAFLRANPPLPIERRRLMVEVGTTRENVPGQGSTRLLAQYCNMCGFDFVTVDMDPRNSRNANRLFERMGVPFRADAARGQDWLANFTGVVDFCFLDAYDFDHGMHSEIRQARYERFLGSRIDEEECHQMHLECAQSLVTLLAPDGIICFDDTWTDDEGKWTAKGTTAMPYLLANGFEVLEARNRAAILRRKG